MNIMAGLGVAVREYQLTTGEADYGLYIDGKVAGVIEAISILYSRPYAAGLRYSQVKELARRLSIKPFHIDEFPPKIVCEVTTRVSLVADVSIEWRLGA